MNEEENYNIEKQGLHWRKKGSRNRGGKRRRRRRRRTGKAEGRMEKVEKEEGGGNKGIANPIPII